MRGRHSEESEPERVVVRDKRRIDPVSGVVRDPVSWSPPSELAADPAPTGVRPTTGSSSADEQQLAAQIVERTVDLQRLQAEFANYRKRVERDRLAVAEQALASVLVGLLPVLDDIGRARAHGELEGGFKSVAESLEAAVSKLGLTQFGEPGEPFDPMVHEALMHTLSAQVDVPTAVEVLQPGYRLGERVLRPARVAVAEPGEPEAPAGEE